jgi:hypothetical protein
MPLETLARLAAALLFSALRPLMAIRAGIIQKRSQQFAGACRLFIDTVHFLVTSSIVSQ